MSPTPHTGPDHAVPADGPDGGAGVGVSLLDLLVALARSRWLIAGLVVLFGAAGVALSSLREPVYRATAVVVEDKPNAPNAAALSALRGFGINLGQMSTGIAAAAYPDVLKSREVTRSVVADTFQLATGERVRLRDALLEPSPLAELLGRGDAPEGPPLLRAAPPDTAGVYVFSREELRAMKALEDAVVMGTDTETRLMGITVTLRDPLLAALVADRMVEELKGRVRALYGQKAQENVRFVREQYEAAVAQARTAEARLQRFEDRNLGITTAELRLQRDRLQQEVSFAQQVFSSWREQLTQAQLEVQRGQPVIMVVQQPTVPLAPSGLGRGAFVALWVLFGLFLGVGLALVRELFRPDRAAPADRAKLEELRGALVPWRRRAPARNGVAASTATAPAPPEPALEPAPPPEP